MKSAVTLTSVVSPPFPRQAMDEHLNILMMSSELLILATCPKKWNHLAWMSGVG